MRANLRVWVVLGLVIFLYSVIVNAPASIAGKFLQGSGIYAQNYSGSLWQGHASGLALNIGGEAIYLDYLDWDLHALSLLWFSPTADISGQGQGLSVKGEAGLLGDGHWRMEDGDISFPAELIGQTTMGAFAGTMSFQIKKMEVEKRTVKALQGRAVWQSARWLPDRRWWTLGNFAADLSSTTGNILATVFDQGGPIGLKGKVTVKLSGSYDFSGDIKARDAAPEELNTALSVIGEPQPDDSYRVSFQGKFPVN